MNDRIRFPECLSCVNFEDCNSDVCDECPAGEQYEPVDEREPLDFSEGW
tara:strand:+ start:1258 stop:1404 length:147 start_codon:yes stop_codon:yes gene_type:complete